MIEPKFFRAAGNPMTSRNILTTACLSALIIVSACAALQVGQDVQAGRNALQTGRPGDAVSFLTRAAAQDPNYVIPYRLRVSVLTYLGRAQYETGRDSEARATLEKALLRDQNDFLARLYLGLALLRSGDRDRGAKEIQLGLKGLYEWLEYIASDSQSGPFWDPAGQIRGDIVRATALKPNSPELVGLTQRIGSLVDEEIDRARRDEARIRYGRGESS
jgi:tetratricopeptide (TPR) repeat protein